MSAFTARALFEALGKDLDASYNVVQFGDFPSKPQRDFAVELMRDKFLSKFVPRADPVLDGVARTRFSQLNVSNSLFRPYTDLNSSDEQLVGTFLKYLSDFFENELGDDCSWDWGNIALHARSGPGVSNGGRGTSFYEKYYAGPLTASSPFLVDLYRADVNLWPEECIAESIRQMHFGEPQLVGGSKISFVPKTVKTSRMISIEPSLNMFYQLGIGAILEKRLKRFFGIDLATQPDVNRCLAKLGSTIDSTFGDGFATIDLASASDTISLALCGYAIPAEPLDRMLMVRSPRASITLDNGEQTTIQLHCMSTMGNGFTFPLQTAIFAAVAAASVAQDDSILTMPKAWSEMHIGGSYSVFGDDIIVSSRAADRTLRLLTLLGFIPNHEKCFTSGAFRESCGFDFYQGFNVRPFFLRKVDTVQDLNVVFNGLVEWAARCLVPIPSALDYVRDWINSLGGTYFVPLGDDSTSGIRVPRSVLPILRKDRDTQSIAYSRFEAVAGRLQFKDGGRPMDKSVFCNPIGLFVSILRGECRSGVISTRSPKLTFRTKHTVSPNWDHRVNSIQGWFDDYSKSFASFPRRASLIIGGHLPRLLTKTKDVNHFRRKLKVAVTKNRKFRG